MSEDESDFLSIIHVIWAADEQKERADWKRSLMVPKRQTRDVLKHVYRLYSMAFTKSYCDLLPWVKEKTSGFNNIFFFTIFDQYLYYNLYYNLVPGKSMVPHIWVRKWFYSLHHSTIRWLVFDYFCNLENSVLNKRKLTRTACEVIFFEVQNKHIFLMI